MEFLVIWLLFGVAAAVVGSNRGESGIAWFFGGVLLGPIGWALAFTAGVRCPHCQKKISAKASICGHCQQPLKKD